VNGETITSDLVLSGADYHHTETLLDKEFRAYSEKYWDSFCSFIFIVLLLVLIKLKTYHIMLCFDVDFISMQKIFMMHHSGQRASVLC
jgi:phytoene desaturase